MSAKYSCNVCNGDVPPEDGHALVRASGFYGVYLSPTSHEGAPPSPGGHHLCVKCACKILTEGKRPLASDSDEIPF
jgi:hypothetical protein